MRNEEKSQNYLAVGILYGTAYTPQYLFLCKSISNTVQSEPLPPSHTHTLTYKIYYESAVDRIRQNIYSSENETCKTVIK